MAERSKANRPLAEDEARADVPDTLAEAGTAELANTEAAAVATTGTLAANAAVATRDAQPQRAAAVSADAQNVTDAALPSKGYGEFVKEVGLAVAEAQKALDDNSVEAALKLAATEIPALVALNQVVNEDGEIEKVEPVIQKDAKLIQYIQPTFYQWKQVTLYARFDVKTFKANAATEITSNVHIDTSTNGSVGYGLVGKANWNANANFNSQVDTSVDASYATAQSTGTSYMLAVLEPRTDTRFPPPIIAVQGPRLRLTSTVESLPPATEQEPKTATLTVELYKKDGFKATGNKIVELTLQGPGQLAASSITLAQTDPNNNTRLSGTVILTRRPADPADTVVIRASLGTLVGTLAVKFLSA